MEIEQRELLRGFLPGLHLCAFSLVDINSLEYMVAVSVTAFLRSVSPPSESSFLRMVWGPPAYCLYTTPGAILEQGLSFQNES